MCLCEKLFLMGKRCTEIDWVAAFTWLCNWPLCDSITLTLDSDNVDPQQPVEWLQRHTGHFGIFILWMEEKQTKKKTHNCLRYFLLRALLLTWEIREAMKNVAATYRQSLLNTAIQCNVPPFKVVSNYILMMPHIYTY